MFKTVAITIGAIALFLASVFGLQYFGLASFSFFAPRYEQVRNDTFHNSQAYTDGMANDLADLQIQYMTAAPESQPAIAALIRQRFASYDKTKLPAELRDFYFSIQ